MPLRELHHHGQSWTVWDTTPGEAELIGPHLGGVHAEMQPGWITFECIREKRRLVPLVEGWDRLPDEDLADLLERAMIVRRAP